MKRQSNKQAKGRAKRALKSWTKGPATVYDNDEVVPSHSVPMRPRSKRIQHKSQLDLTATIRGRVVDSSGRGWLVDCEPSVAGNARRLDCVPSRSIVTENSGATLIAVGDIVNLLPNEPEPEGQMPGSLASAGGVIVYVAERRTKLARMSAGRASEEQVLAANIDQLLILVSSDEPPYNKRLIDRYLVAARYGDLAPILIVNKMDLADEEGIAEDLQVYRSMPGLPVLLISVKRNEGVSDVRDLLRNKTSVFSGPSGVGKSSLVNSLAGEELQDTCAINLRTNKGMHTTTYSRIVRLPENSYIVDTPGIREFGIWDVPADELSFYFDDFESFREHCRFGLCTHTHEPGCGIKSAVEAGDIDPERYESYLFILASLQG